jgi:TonB family protein
MLIRLTLLFIFILFISTVDFGQQKKSTAVKAGFGVAIAQSQPTFPGGSDSLSMFLNKNLQYPEQASLEGIHGKVWVGFIVDKDGNIKDERILKSVDESIDNEALRLVRLMPLWKPGTINNSPADMQYILPIEFVIPKRGL